jgi:hypothetical protein
MRGITIALLAISATSWAAEPAPDLDKLRHAYLDDIFVLRDYRPGKNSFVEGPDRRWGAYTKPGQRLTLLDVAGPGRLCHIWSTWRKGQGNHRLEFYIDGQAKAELAGTLDELIDAANRMPAPPQPVVGFVGNRDARNLFLPVPFAKRLRIEMETIEPTWLIFWQIDYRLDDPAAGSERLDAALVDGKLQLQWHGDRQVSPLAPTGWDDVGGGSRFTLGDTIAPGKKVEIARIEGPAIVSEWTFTPASPGTEQKLILEVTYDSARRPAIRAPLADFFGPFVGVSLATDAKSKERTCRLPMAFAKSVRFAVENRGKETVGGSFSARYATRARWNPAWGYLHALGQTTNPTLGYRQHQVLYTRGRGHWLGMALYNTGHDHGGGDFAIVDGEGPRPAFLHGVNGEDYFTFAWFGRGQHHPFAVADTNEAGRYRHHFENPYPFRKSISVYWGTYADLATRSVAYWYQDSPDDLTVPDGTHPLQTTWDCFGPVPLRLDAQQRPVGDLYAVLPSVADLDAGKQFECRCIQERFTSGWMQQPSIGPMLDLTYLARHGTRIKGEIELGGMGHAFLARRFIDSPAKRQATFQISHDDPLRVLVNGQMVYDGPGTQGFETRRFAAPLIAGRNEIVVQLTSFFNVTFNWAGFLLREVEAESPP